MADSFDRLLARSERRGGPPPGPCPDAAELAAYLDGTLTNTERSALESHAADCARCALQLATIVRLEDESGHPQHAPVTPRWRRVAWMVPAATAAVVAAVYLAVPSSVPPPAPSRDSQREAPAAPPPAATAASDAPEQDGATNVGNASAPAPARKSSAELSKETMPVPRTALAEAAPPPAGAPGVMAGADARDLPSPASLPQQAGTQVRAEATAQEAPALGRSASASLRMPESQAAQPLTVESADGLVQWRVTGPRVERTPDGGRTWFPERTPAITDITMGVAASSTVCWLATRSGRVIRRTDEGEWHEVSPVPLNPLARIESAGPGDARLVGLDGTTITTADGGLSWTRQAPR